MKISDFAFDDNDSRPDLDAPAGASAPGTADSRAASIVARFAEQLAARGEHPAVVDENGAYSYAELDARANRIARVLLGEGLSPETRVGVMIERTRDFIAAMLGVLKAGCVYVPIDPTLPLERRRLLLTLADAQALIGSARTAGDLQQLEWLCPSLRVGLVVDSDDFDALCEAPGEMMSAELWDHLASDAADDIAAGGWKSAFTGLPLSHAAMAAFGANARDKIAAILRPGARVLEIGCASGFTMRHVAPLAASYLATDLSRHNAERVESVARQLGLPQVSGRHLAAHDIDLLPAASFDLIVMNSVIESFPGYGYLRAVLDKAVALLAPGGTLYLGSLWNIDRRDAYLADLAAFARDHAGEGYTTRSDLAGSFFVAPGFFSDWAARRDERPSLEASAIAAPGFDPAPYGFDLQIRFDGRGEQRTGGIVLDRRAAPRHLDRRAMAAESPRPPALAVGARQAAYVIFTSGSSGRPKGVLVEHAPVINMVNAIETRIYAPLAARLAIARPLAISCCFSFAFDGSIHQIFTPLLNGHTLHLPDEETRQDPRRLHAFIEAHRLDVVDASPSLFAMLVDHWRESAGQSSADCFILGGEALARTLVERFYERPGHRDCEVWNQYGPTETCVVASQYRLTATNWQELSPPPIGAPLPGVELAVCDAAGRPLPVGIPGEIRIGGAGLARGYLGEEALTARQFVFDADGRRWYRSGDVGRWLRPGLLHFMGREDRQVKVRGYRIELPEIESALLASPLVRQAAVVVADPRRDGDHVLVAYVVARPGFDAGRCRAELDARLPAWMIPAWIIAIDEIPLTVNGKLDEQRLPSPMDGTPSGTRAPCPLTSDTERKLAEIWHAILDLPVSNADDDFFMLGGHSVLAVRLLSLIESEFGIRLPLAELFTAATVARMAERIEARQSRSAWHPVVTVRGQGRRAPLVCFHPVGGNVICYKGLAEALADDRPIYMVQSAGLEEGQVLQASVEAMVGDYLKGLREVLADADAPLLLLGWSFGGLLAWEAACQLRRAGAVVDGVIVVDGVASPEPVRALLQKDEAEYLATLFAEMGLGDAQALRRLTPEQRLDLIVERARGGDFLPDGIDRASMRRLLALFQNNGLAAVRYRPPPSDVRLLLVRPRVASSQAPGLADDETNGWGALATSGVDLRWIDGNHGQMLTPRYVGQLAAHIDDHLARTGATMAV